MRTSEKRDSKAEVKIYRNRSRSYCEERFSLTTLLSLFAAARNNKWFLEVPINLYLLKCTKIYFLSLLHKNIN